MEKIAVWGFRWAPTLRRGWCATACYIAALVVTGSAARTKETDMDMNKETDMEMPKGTSTCINTYNYLVARGRREEQ